MRERERERERGGGVSMVTSVKKRGVIFVAEIKKEKRETEKI